MMRALVAAALRLRIPVVALSIVLIVVDIRTTRERRQFHLRQGLRGHADLHDPAQRRQRRQNHGRMHSRRQRRRDAGQSFLDELPG
jgi:hypothetical protein